MKLLIPLHYCCYSAFTISLPLSNNSLSFSFYSPVASNNGCIIQTLFSRLHIILNKYFPIFFISVTFVQFSTYLIGYTFIYSEACTTKVLCTSWFVNILIPRPEYRGQGQDIKAVVPLLLIGVKVYLLPEGVS
jgi:hypothetical protein